MLLYGKKVKQWIFQTLLLSMMSKFIDAVNCLSLYEYQGKDAVLKVFDTRLQASSQI